MAGSIKVEWLQRNSNKMHKQLMERAVKSIFSVKQVKRMLCKKKGVLL